MKKRDIKDMTAAELKEARDAISCKSPKWWPLHEEWRRKNALQLKEAELAVSEIDIKLAKNRAEKAKLDLSSRAIEPNPHGSLADPVK